MRLLRVAPTVTCRLIGTGILVAALSCVSGTVFACEFRAGSTTGSIAFGVLDPVTAPTVTSAIQLEVRCTPPGDYAIAQWTWVSANGGATIGKMAGGTPPYAPGIDYTVGIVVSGSGANQTLTLNFDV